MKLTKSEENMWDVPVKDKEKSFSINEINEKYENGEQRILTESNREKLPNFVEALKRPGYLEIKPFYQRRSRWDVERQSKLIESFIINIPVPPIFLYEKSYNQYEVMDGQQRITAIKEFYNNEYKLKGLDIWPELNGFNYADLPIKVKAGLDRRSLSSIILLKESAPDEENAILLRQLVFERLNTGGVKLERQEIRNALNKGKMNDLLFRLSKNEDFRKVWGLPEYTPEEDKSHNLPIFNKNFFKKMEDLEIVLRFFALRHMDNYKYGLQGFLDLYMVRSNAFTEEDCDQLEVLYLTVLRTLIDIYDDKIFRIYDGDKWSKQPTKSVYDAEMVALTYFLDKKDTLINNKDRILASTKQLFLTKDTSSFTGRASTKQDIINRINYFKDIFSDYV